MSLNKQKRKQTKNNNNAQQVSSTKPMGRVG